MAQHNLIERSKYIPVRLTHEERKKLRLVEAALNVSEYTNHVDNGNFFGKTKRIHAQLNDICAILSGLLVARFDKEMWNDFF